MLPYEKLSLLVFLFAIFLIYSLEFKFLVARLFGKKQTPSTFQSGIHILAISGIVCFLYGYFIEPYWIDVHHVEIHTPKLKKTSLTVVQISDLHCDPKLRAEPHMIKIINDLKPDVIVFTGDSLNSPLGYNNFKTTLKTLRANISKFAVKGNWDTNFWNRTNFFGDTGFVELQGNVEPIKKDGEEVNISGLPANRLLEGLTLPKDKFNIFLYHYPDLIEEIAPVNVDLYLAGHTHGGQVALPFYGALITFSKFGKKYEAGRYQVNGTTLYVNRGIGMEGGNAPRVRFFSRPEITVFKIGPQKEK